MADPHLPYGMRCIGYDDYSQVTSYEDQDGKVWETKPGSKYGPLRRARSMSEIWARHVSRNTRSEESSTHIAPKSRQQYRSGRLLGAFKPEQALPALQGSTFTSTPIPTATLSKRGPRPFKLSQAGKAYVYSVLESERHIRLLSVQSVSSFTQSTKSWDYEIILTTLDDLPPFETVSYVWGDESRKHTLTFVDGSFLSINKNLASALSHLSSSCTTGYLWIDQVCIHQMNFKERSHQVGLMKDIYTRGVRNLVYMDCKGLEEVQNLPSLLKTLSVDTKTNANDLKAVVREAMDIKYEDGVGTRRHTTKWRNWYSLVQLLKHTWFTRAWIFQEVVLSKSVTFLLDLAGAPVYEISFSGLVNLAYVTGTLEIELLAENRSGECVRGVTGFDHLYAMARMRYERAGQMNRRNFWEFLSEIAPSSCSSNGRDRIYAFLGLLDDDAINIKPDYSSTERVVLIKTAAAIVRGQQDLNILGLVDRRDRGSPRQLERLPTWVPDWRLHESMMPILSWSRQSVFSAANRRLHSTRQLSNSEMPCGLLVMGKIVTKIQQVTTPFTSMSNWPRQDIRELLNLEKRLKELNESEGILINMERLLKVVIADGVLSTTNHHGLSEDRITELTRSYMEETNMPKASGIQSKDIQAILFYSRIASSRCVILTECKRMGLASWSAEENDVVAILHGSGVPIILRNITNNVYEVIGQAYIEGIMHGEAIGWEINAANEFILV